MVVFLTLAAGCSANGVENYEEVEQDKVSAEALAGNELARIEFSDGNVVRFEELAGGVLVSEVGAEVNPPHLTVGKGQTALEAFRSLAPERPIPERLRNVLFQMHPPGAVNSEGVSASSREDLALLSTGTLDLEADPTSLTLKSLSASQFLGTMCDFPVTGSSYKHTNRTNLHVDASLNVHEAYFAVGSDKGVIIASACAGENSGGQFNGQCSSGVAVPSGFSRQGFYDAGEDCRRACSGCPIRCFTRVVRFETHFDSISDNVNFHDCADLSTIDL